MSNWQWEDFGEYVEVVPTNDIKQHFAGDECWCKPTVEREQGSRPLISHNASGKLRITEVDTAIHFPVNEWMLAQGFTWGDDMSWHKFNNGNIHVHQSAAEYFYKREQIAPKEKGKDE